MNREGQKVPQVTFRARLGNANRSRIVGAIAGAGTVPQVFINGTRVGGLEELERWAKNAGASSL